MTARLAIVDDDAAFTGYLQTLLGAQGYDVEVFNSGTSLLDGLRSGVAPNVVLLDVLMPDLDGLETLRAIRQARPAAQVIMLSGRQAPQTIVEAVRLGAVDYVLKPDDAEGIGEAALEAAIRNALERESLTEEVSRMRAQAPEDPAGTQLSWSSGTAMQPVLSMVDRVADSDVTVLIRGESGVGKELVARTIHDRSPRRTRPMVKVNCAALPDELLESELFGHEKGSFTGASALRIGKFEHAHQSTLMLDEIGEMKPGLQGKLLHVLQDGDFSRLGSNKRVTADVRVIAATNRDLESMLPRAEFREDLYYRLRVIEITVPPLRERIDELHRLFDYFVDKYARRYNRSQPTLSPALRESMERYHWPGNIRELENVVKRFVILQDEALLRFDLLTERPQPTPESYPAVDDPPPARAQRTGHGPAQTLPELARAAMLQAERDLIIPTLHRVHWNRRKAAPLLGISYKTLLNKMREHGIIQE